MNCSINYEANRASQSVKQNKRVQSMSVKKEEYSN